MRVAYFINHYPKVSHSFIRRELQALEALGVEVRRYALHGEAAELVDAADREEVGVTRYVLRAGVTELLGAALASLREDLRRFGRAWVCAIRMGWRSDRGLLRHLAYLLEACVLRRWFEQDGIEHVHAHFGTNPAAVALLVHALGGPRYSFTVHGPEEFDKPEFLALTAKIQAAHFVVAVSSFGRSQLYRCLPTDQWHKVQVVHCGLAPDFLTQAPEPLSATRRFVCVGRLCEQKGQILLVRAVARLAALGERIELVLAGDGPLRGELESEIRERQLEPQVRITGWLDSSAVREQILQSRALVLPSFAEGLPVVLMEALALERPVISTYVAGIPELVLDQQNGWLIPAGCLDSLVEALREAVQMSDERLRAMGQAGRLRVLQRHDVQCEAQKLMRLLAANETEIAGLGV
jgi:colanic acid/amylovoran biosynthesis glycosyltransferase